MEEAELTTIREKTYIVIERELGYDPRGKNSTKSFYEMGADSLDIADLLLEFEDEFGLESIDDPESDGITTPDQFIEYLQNRFKTEGIS